LPRGNQEQVAQVIARRGLTTRQTTRLVEQLLAAGDERARGAILAEVERASASSAPRAVRAPVTPGEAMIADAAALATRATRLQVRLLERPVTSLGAEVERIVVGRLGELQAVLVALCQTLAQVSSTSTMEVNHGA
jgi:hypothetical protein